MALETRKTTINDTTYHVTQLQAPVGCKVLVRLAKALGPALAAGSSGDVADAIRQFTSNLDEATLDYVIDVFKKNTEIELSNGNSVGLDSQFALHFAGKYGEMLKWLQFCIEYNFSDFLSVVKRHAPASASPKLDQ